MEVSRNPAWHKVNPQCVTYMLLICSLARPQLAGSAPSLISPGPPCWAPLPMPAPRFHNSRGFECRLPFLLTLSTGGATAPAPKSPMCISNPRLISEPLSACWPPGTDALPSCLFLSHINPQLTCHLSSGLLTLSLLIPPKSSQINPVSPHSPHGNSAGKR